MDKWLNRRAHIPKSEGSIPSPDPTQSMREDKQKPTYEELPLDPENDPPEVLEDLEVLIEKLQNKAASIKQQLEVVAIREKQNLAVDYTRVKRALFARAQTNKSITALQRIAKVRRQQAALKSGNSFEKFFFEAAKEKLAADVLTDVMGHTFFKMREAEKLDGKC